jgi:hypothetical protein
MARAGRVRLHVNGWTCVLAKLRFSSQGGRWHRVGLEGECDRRPRCQVVAPMDERVGWWAGLTCLLTAGVRRLRHVKGAG